MWRRALHRGYHGLAMPTWNRKIRVFADWTLAMFLKREVVSLGAMETPGEEFYEATEAGSGSGSGSRRGSGRRQDRGEGRPDLPGHLLVPEDLPPSVAGGPWHCSAAGRCGLVARCPAPLKAWDNAAFRSARPSRPRERTWWVQVVCQP